jgi:hypothetical protein
MLMVVPGKTSDGPDGPAENHQPVWADVA